jgi:hypothetical protein
MHNVYDFPYPDRCQWLIEFFVHAEEGNGKDTNDRNSKMQMNQEEEVEEQQQQGDDIMSQFSDASISRTFISRLYAQIGRGQLPSEADAASFEEPSMQTRPPTPEEPRQQEIKKENAMAVGDNDNDDEEEEDNSQQMPPAVPQEEEEERIAMDDSGDNRESKEEEFSLGDRHPASIRVEVKRSHRQQQLGGLQGQLPAESQDLKDGPPPVNYVEFARRMNQQQQQQQPASVVNRGGRANGGGGDPPPPFLPPANGGGGGPPPAGPQSHISANESAYLALSDMSRAWIRFVALLASHFGITEADVVEPGSSFEFKDASEFNQVWFMRLRTKFNGLCAQALEEVSRATGVSQKKNCSRLVLNCPEDFVALTLLIDTDINVLKGAIWVKQTTRVDSARTRISLLQNIAKSLGLRVRLREWC